MIKNYLLITFRNLGKNRIFIAINVLGMGIAIACCIISYLNWDFTQRFDEHHVNRETIYRVQAFQVTKEGRNRYAAIPNAIGNIVKENFKSVNKVVRYTTSQGTIRIEDEVFKSPIAYADSGFFDLFTFHFKSATSARLGDKGAIFISEVVARKYFNSENVVGKSITQVNHGKTKEFVVAGVFEEQPLNSSFAFEAITHWDNFWDTTEKQTPLDNDWNVMSTLFIQIKNPEAVDQVTKQLQGYIDLNNLAREDFQLESFYLQQFKTLASAFYGDTWLHGEQLRWGMPPSAVLGPGIMAILLLLLACFNFTNTFIAISGKRLKEIGIRKTMGGMRGQLIFQFLSESILVCFFSLIVGLFFAEVLVPIYNSLWPGVKLTIDFASNFSFFIFLASLLLFTGFIAGVYPAIYISSFKPVNILKGNTRLAGSNWLTRSLLAFQLSISLVCMICSVAYMKNASFQEVYNLGYSKNETIRVPIENHNQFIIYKNALLLNKDIRFVAGSKNHVSDKYYKASVKSRTIEHTVEVVDIGDDYMEAMNIQLLEGRYFQKDSESDRKESVIVSKEFVRRFGWGDNPIGKRILFADSLQLFVVGVVNDIHTDGFWKPVAPVLFRYIQPEQYTQLVVSTTQENIVTVNEFMKEEWKKISPNTVYEGRLTDGNVYASQMINKNVSGIFGFFGLIAAWMSATGLFALVSLNAKKKLKQIGIRKVLGASPWNIARVVNQEFFFTFIAASALGSLLGYLMTDTMMDAIWEYYLRTSVTTLLSCVLILLAIAIFTVAFKTIATARINPVNVLKEN